MENYNDNSHHEVESFDTTILPVKVIYDGFSAYSSPLQLVEIKLAIHYRKTVTYAYKELVGERLTTIHVRENEDRIDNRTIIRLFLSDLNCVHHRRGFLCSKLSNLDIEPRHHERVIAKIMRCVEQIEEKMEAEAQHRRAVLVPIIMDVSLSIVEWICSYCMEDRQRMWLIKEMLNGRRVNYNCGSEAICAICLEEFGVGRNRVVVRTPCSHDFHEECVLKWLQNTPSCPLCRFNMSIWND